MHLGELWAVQAGDELAGAWSHRHELLVQCHCLVAANVPVGRDRVVGLGWSQEEGLTGQPRRKEQEVGPFRHFWAQLEPPTPTARTKPEPQGLLAFASA